MQSSIFSAWLWLIWSGSQCSVGLKRHGLRDDERSGGLNSALKSAGVLVLYRQEKNNISREELQGMEYWASAFVKTSADGRCLAGEAGKYDLRLLIK